ncbi:MAG: hypothetical protein ACP5NW_00365 [Candidatus Woesearchaeota archaeon]
MIKLSEAIREHIISRKSKYKISSTAKVTILEDRIKKMGDKMYTLEFLVRVSDENAPSNISTIQSNGPIYESESLLHIEDIMNSEYYSNMSEFSIDNTKTVQKSYLLLLPTKILIQHYGMEEFLRLKKQKGTISEDFMILCDKNNKDKEIIMMPKNNYEAMSKIGKPAQKFLNHFKERYDIRISTTTLGAFKINGIPASIRRPGRGIRFYADNQFYIHLEKAYD